MGDIDRETEALRLWAEEGEATDRAIREATSALQARLKDMSERLESSDALRLDRERATLDLHTRVEAQAAEIERLREALKVYAGPMEWQNLEGGHDGWGRFPVWADGYPGGVYVDDNTLDFGDAARAALGETK
jgi:hypothetical protein